MSGDDHFLIVPTLSAMESVRALDGHMQLELREHAAKLAEDPVGLLHRATGEPVGTLDIYEYAYNSELAAGIRVRLLLTDFDRAQRRMTLLWVATTSVSEA